MVAHQNDRDGARNLKVSAFDENPKMIREISQSERHIAIGRWRDRAFKQRGPRWFPAEMHGIVKIDAS